MVRWNRLLAGVAVALVACAAGFAAPPGGPQLAGCPVFPANNVWNARVDGLPAASISARVVASIGTAKPLHPDFGSGLWDGGPIGIPVTAVPAGQPALRVAFDYAGESDPGPYPIPAGVKIEGGANSTGDRHAILVQQGSCRLFELYDLHPAPGGWTAGSGATWDLKGNALRQAGWTSADAAGLPILPGLARFEELAGGIHHALRFTAPLTRRAFVWPARHHAGATADPAFPAMGARFRLKAGFDTAGFGPQARAVLRALKDYGMILADNGSSWFVSGVPDERWDNDDLRGLGRVKGSDFELVDAGRLQAGPDSAAVR
ncbi:MAG TPA: hypothetical protein VHN99_00525 [Deinococcales bacterium]|nr:hypothetical protein [Deinococcales bacterium]